MSGAYRGGEYCPQCGSKMKEKWIPNYNMKTGKIKDYDVIFTCPKWWKLLTCGNGYYRRFFAKPIDKPKLGGSDG